MSTIFRKLLGDPECRYIKGDLGELKNWLTMIERQQQLIYKLSEAETVLLAYNMSEGQVSEF